MIAKVSKEDLIAAVARELGYPKKIPALLRARLEEYRHKFCIIFSIVPESFGRFADLKDKGPTQQRDRYNVIEKRCLETAKALWFAPPEMDWYPNRSVTSAPALTEERLTATFSDDMRCVEQKIRETRQKSREVERSGDRLETNKLRRKLRDLENTRRVMRRKLGSSFPLSVEQEKAEPPGDYQAPIGLSELTLLLVEVSKAARQAADRLPIPRAKGIPEKDAAAHYAWILVKEFYRQPGLHSVEIKDQQRRMAVDYVKRPHRKRRRKRH